eukprot:GEMP01022451.1.p1 GENE.GEMP01022451.1~~GEMP01022451.1.p1  ORF type:complete len:219 (+),score=33.07 GEMP01022451.1:252-908(+)
MRLWFIVYVYVVVVHITCVSGIDTCLIANCRQCAVRNEQLCAVCRLGYVLQEGEKLQCREFRDPSKVLSSSPFWTSEFVLVGCCLVVALCAAFIMFTARHKTAHQPSIDNENSVTTAPSTFTLRGSAPDNDDDLESQRRHGAPLTHMNAAIGRKIIRGPHWNSRDEDGGAGNMGTLVGQVRNSWLVKWDCGRVRAYPIPRSMEDGPYELAYPSPSDAE